MYSITKQFDFCYGHRIWNQQLSNNAECKCRRFHGHSGQVDITLSGDSLTQGMLLDFNELKPIKEFINTVIDHRFLLDINDPILDLWLKNQGMSWDDLGYMVDDYWVVDSSTIHSTLELEWFDSLVIIDFVPTSEHLAQWLFKTTQHHVKLAHGLLCDVTWHESTKSKAVVTGVL